MNFIKTTNREKHKPFESAYEDISVLSYQFADDLHTTRIQECQTMLNGVLSDLKLIKEFHHCIPAVEAKNVDGFIDELETFGTLAKLQIHKSELQEVPPDARLDMIECSCEGVLSSIWEFIVKVCVAIKDAIWNTLAFIAKIFGFDIEGSSGGGGGGGGGGSSSGRSSRDTRTTPKNNENNTKNSRASKKVKTKASTLNKTVNKQNSKTKQTIRDTYEVVNTNIPPAPPVATSDRHMMEKIGYKFFESTLELEDYLANDIVGKTMTKEMAKLYLYRYCDACGRYLDVKYGTMSDSNSLVPRKLMFMTRIESCIKYLTLIADFLEPLLGVDPANDVENEKNINKFIDAVLHNLTAWDALMDTKIKHDDPILIKFKKTLMQKSDIESRNVILGSYGPVTNQVDSSGGYLENASEVTNLYIELQAKAVHLSTAVALITEDIDSFRTVDAYLVNGFKDVLVRTTSVSKSMIMLATNFLSKWNVDSVKLEKFMTDCNALSIIINK